MTSAQLYERVLATRLRHAMLLETAMVRLVRAIGRASAQQAAVLRKDYEWYAAAAKALSTKDLMGLGKMLADEEEPYLGFDDG